MKSNRLPNDITEIMETSLILFFLFLFLLIIIIVGVVSFIGVVSALNIVSMVNTVRNGSEVAGIVDNLCDVDYITTIGIRFVVNLALDVTDEGNLAGIDHIADACSQTGDSPSFIIKSGFNRDSAGEVVLSEDILELVLLKINSQVTVADLGVKVVVFKGV